MKRILQLVLIALAMRILFFSVSCILNASEGKPVQINFNSFVGIYYQNDSFWYEKIAHEGYPKITNPVAIGFSYKETYIQSSWAFFPLYPYMNRALMNTFKIDFPVSAFILSFAFSIFAFIGFYQFCLIYFTNEAKAFFITLVFIVLPFHYYYFVFYTEALFFTFLIYSFLALHYHKLWSLPLLLVPLILLRPNGLILTVPLFCYYLEVNGILSGYKINLKAIKLGKLFAVSMGFLAAIIAFAIYAIYQKEMTGSFFAFSIAQRGWYRESMFPLLAFFRRGDFATQFNSFYTIMVIAFAALYCRKLPLSLNILLWLSLIFPLCSGSVTSMQRFIIIIFPLAMIVGDWLYGKKYAFVFLMVALATQMFLFSFWLRGDSFSF